MSHRLLANPAPAGANLVAQVRSLSSGGKGEQARKLIEERRSQSGISPELLEALSWLARGELARKEWDRAELDAKQTYDLASELMKSRPLDAEPRLQTAVGAAIEVQAQALAARGETGRALQLLRAELVRYGQSSIALRLQKNLNLLTLEGKAAPSIASEQFLGPKPPSLASLRGKTVLLFLWAHWCGDCKAQEPILARLRADYGGRGLVLIAPTQTYGAAGGGIEATPEVETAYIDEVRRRAYPSLVDVPVPVSSAIFRSYGASTVPTLVLINPQGTVTMYHPGRMTDDELRPQVEAALPSAAKRPPG